jgi:DNA polymerase-3 subunit epsilon
MLPGARQRMIMIDCEGTGYNEPDRLCLVEIALIEVRDGQATGNFLHSRLNPKTHINAHATKVHGITEKSLVSEPLFEDLAQIMLDFIGEDPICMHSATSDLKSINHDLTLSGFQNIPEIQIMDSEKIGKALLGVKDLSLNTLCDLLGVDRTQRTIHSAILDAKLMTRCMVKMLNMPKYESIRNHPQFSPKTYVPQVRQSFGRYIKPGQADLTEITKLGPIDLPRMSVIPTKLTFTDREGQKISVEVPDFDQTTHTIYLSKLGSYVVTKKSDDENYKNLPDNPIGPAVVFARKGAVRQSWYENGIKTKEVEVGKFPDSTNKLHQISMKF